MLDEPNLSSRAERLICEDKKNMDEFLQWTSELNLPGFATTRY